MQAYRVEQLVVPTPGKVERVAAVINLEHLILWQPHTLHGVPCTVLKLIDVNLLHPVTTPHLTWIHIAEDFEAFTAKMLALNTKGPTEPTTPTNPTDPPLPPLTQSLRY